MPDGRDQAFVFVESQSACCAVEFLGQVGDREMFTLQLVRPVEVRTLVLIARLQCSGHRRFLAFLYVNVNW